MNTTFVRGWPGSKYDTNETPSQGNVASSWQWRELGMTPKGSASNTRILQETAEDHLVNKVHLNERCCEVPGMPRSTFLMVFSPDGTKVASTHGNHNVHVSELSSGKHVKTLSGHPRTPWCVAFHPSHTQLLGSGCLGGQVRVWDLSGGSEVWTVGGETVIASIAFHPRDQLLVIATYNELYFWDWSQPQPFTKVQTNTIKEKVRFVSFDALGHKLITGISVWSLPGVPGSLLHPSSGHTQSPSPYSLGHPPTGNTPQDQISTYHQLLQRYDILVRNYRQLFMARSQLTNTTDRGTDPMEVDWATPQPSTSSGSARTLRLSPRNPDTSRPNNSDSESTNEGTNSTNPTTSDHSSVFGQARHFVINPSTLAFSVENRLFRTAPLGSHQSAFHPLSEPRRQGNVRSDRNDSTPSTTDRPNRPELTPSTNPDLYPHPFSVPSARRTDANSNHPSSSSQTTYIRNELTASLNRLQGFMENSIDETLSFWERYESARTSLNYSQQLALNLLRRTRRLAEPPLPTTSQLSAGGVITSAPNRVSNAIPNSANRGRNLFISYRNVFSTNVPDIPNINSIDMSDVRGNNIGQLPPPPSPPPPPPPPPLPPLGPPSLMLDPRLESLGDILRDSGHRLFNLISDITDSNTNAMERQILHNRQQQRRQIPTSSGDRSSLETTMSRSLFSSDDGSDSDREMFSPLPLHIYRTRNLNAPDPASSSNAPNSTDQSNPIPNQMSIPRYIGREVNREIERNRESLPFGETPNESLFFSDSPRNSLMYSQPSTLSSLFRDANEVPIVTATNTSIPDRNENISNANVPSTSAQSQSAARTRTNAVTPEQRERESETVDAFQKVTRGVQAIERHMEALIVLWSGNTTRPPLRQLRRMWEDLRREMVTLQRPTVPGQGPASYFSLTSRTRCQLLTSMTNSERIRTRFTRGPNSSSGSISSASRSRRDQNLIEDNNISNEVSITPTNQENSGTSSSNIDINTDSETRNATSTRDFSLDMPSTSTGITHGHAPRSTHPKTYPPSSKLKANNLRSITRDHNQSMKRRLRSIVLNRITNGNLPTLQRTYPGRGIKRTRQNRNSAFMPRRQELEFTRNSIRVHARRVLAIMFSIMMHCLEADQLGNQIIAMLRSLKKALGLTCLLLMSHPFPNETRQSNSSVQENANAPTEESTQEPINTIDESQSLSPSNPSQPDNISSELPSQGQAPASWSDRIAIQISAVNRNTSSNAKHRKERYHQIKKARALRNCNPIARSFLFRKEMFQYRNLKTGANPGSSSRSSQLPDDAIPSTSGLQNGTNSATFTEPSQSTSNTSDSTGRPATPPNIRHLQNVNLARRIHSRMLFRRYLFNHGFMRDVLGVFRRSEQERNQLVADMETAGILPYGSRVLSVRRPPPHRPSGEGAFDSSNNVVVPSVHVNDMPVSDMVPNEEVLPPLQPIIYQNVLSMEDNGRAGILDANPSMIAETQVSPVHRIQVWDFTQGKIPDISNPNKNIVVHRCKIHNDASIDISKDGRLLVALLPAQRMRSLTHRLGIYSLDWDCLGECLYTALLEQNAVSVSLSPCARHLAVGLGSRRVNLQPYGRNGIMALIFRLGELKKNDNETRHGCLIPIRTLEQSWELGFTSLNCLRWAPQPGQGLVYANNTGQLKILS